MFRRFYPKNRESEMEDTITTDDLKSKLDQKQITLVETLAPERYRERIRCP